MIFRIIVRPEAQTDLSESYRWYEGKRDGLGADFLLQIEVGLEFLRRYPESHPFEYRETRKHLIKRFPYKIIYLITGDTLVVLAVIHVKRSAKVLRQRLEPE